MNTKTPIVKPAGGQDFNWREEFTPGYPLTPDETSRLLKHQGHMCAICHRRVKYPQEKLVLDHDKETGVIRGFLCSQCNLWLGSAEQYLSCPPTKKLGINKLYTCKRSGKKVRSA